MTEIYLTDVTPLCNEETYEKIISFLSHERVKKASSCHLERDRNLSAGAGFLLSFALAKRGVNEKFQKYTYNDCGRPYLSDYLNLSFSLSHSGSMAVCAVSDCGVVGCDIESPERHDIEIAKRFFCAGEYQHIVSSKDPAGEFRRIWTLKESYIKALGTGLKTSLSSFEIILKSPPYVKGDNNFHFTELKLENGYSASVCGTDTFVLPPEIINLSQI